MERKFEGHERQLVCSRQDAVDADGQPQHPGDMAAQLDLALNNLEAVLAAGDMTLANIVRLNAYGVTRLAAPRLLVLLEATATA